MKKQVVVAGLGRFGSSLAKSLYQIGHDVMALDNNGKYVQEIMGQVTYAVEADVTSETVLKELGVGNFDAAIVAIGSDILSSIMATVLFKTLGVPYVVARANNDLHGATLARVGADKVVRPEQEMGVELAHSLFQPHVLEYMEITPNFGVSRLKVPERLVNLTLNETGLVGGKEKYDLSIVAIKRGNNVALTPDPDDKLQDGDILIVAGRDDLLERFKA